MVENSVQERINVAASRLYLWLNTWCQESGAYNGYVVHRYDLKRLKRIHETPWGHCAIIEGLLYLYRKKPLPELKNRIEKAVALQISRLDEDGSFKNAGHEDDRFSSLVHNSMADRALLMYYHSECAYNKLKDEALETVKTNLDQYLIGTLWNEEVGAFKFSKVDYYSLNETRYVANMNCVTIEVMLDMYSICKDIKYLEYSRKCGEWIKTQVAAGPNKDREGGISYGSNNPECLVSIYTGLCLPGLCCLYQQFGDSDYKEIAINAAENLLRYSQDGYFCHSVIGEDRKIYPYFIAGAGIILYGIQVINETFGCTYDTSDYLNNILKHQTSIGAFENFKFYNSKDNRRKRGNEKIRVWEDEVPCITWNGQLFRYLAKNASELPQTNIDFRICHCGPGYFYFESWHKILVLAIWPLNSVVLLWADKKKVNSIIAFSLKKLVQKMKGL